MSLPTELSREQEKLLHDILDEGINDLRHSRPEYFLPDFRLIANAGQETSPSVDLTLTPLSQQRKPSAQGAGPSSVTKQLQEAYKSDPAAGTISREVPGEFRVSAGPLTSSLAMSSNYEKMQRELQTLHEKIKCLEDKLSTSTLSLSALKKDNQPLGAPSRYTESLNSSKTQLERDAAASLHPEPVPKPREATNHKAQDVATKLEDRKDHKKHEEQEQPHEVKVEVKSKSKATSKKSERTTSKDSLQEIAQVVSYDPKGSRKTSSRAPRSQSKPKLTLKSKSKSKRPREKGKEEESLERAGRPQTQGNAKNVDYKAQCEELKVALLKERKVSAELRTKLHRYEGQVDSRSNVYEELRKAKEDYARLKESFEKSEDLRRKQKDVIARLQQELGQPRHVDHDADKTLKRKAKTGKKGTKGKTLKKV